METLDYDTVETRVYSLWKAKEYQQAVEFLRQTISAYLGEDVSVLELCYTLLRSSFVTLGRYTEAEAALREGLVRLPTSFFLQRALAQFLWDIGKQPEQALTVIDHFIAEFSGVAASNITEEKRNTQIEALSLRGRLLLVVGRTEEAVSNLRTILSLLPPFSPVLGHLFDYDLIVGLLRAGVRDEALRDWVNRVAEPRFLVNGISEAEFNKTKQYLNSIDYLPLVE